MADPIAGLLSDVGWLVTVFAACALVTMVVVWGFGLSDAWVQPIGGWLTLVGAVGFIVWVKKRRKK